MSVSLGSSSSYNYCSNSTVTGSNTETESLKLELSKKLLDAVFVKHDYGSIPTLIRAGAYIDSANSNNSSILSAVISARRFDIAKFLIDNGANVSVASFCGFTPLHSLIINLNASKANSDDRKLGFEILHLLIAKHADVNAKDSDGFTSLHLAVLAFCEDLGEDLESSPKDSDLIKILLEAGASMNLKNHQEISPFEMAKILEKKKLVDLFENYEKQLSNKRKHFSWLRG